MRTGARAWLLAAGLAITAAPGQGLAGVTPRPGGADARVRTVDYDPDQVVRVTGVWRTASQIVFSPDETIAHVALGDASAWDVAPEGAILFLKPKAAHGASDMIIATRLPDGRMRSYAFELVTVAASERRAAGGIFVLRFAYPAEEKAAARTALAARVSALSAGLTDLELEAGALEGVRNYAYEVEGAAELQPSEISDNGRFTLLRFPGGQPIPSLYQVAPDGSESLAAFDVRGEFVVVHGVAARFRLRRGHAVLCVYNNGPTAPGPSGAAHTASNNVERVDSGLPKGGPGPGQP